MHHQVIINLGSALDYTFRTPLPPSIAPGWFPKVNYSLLSRTDTANVQNTMASLYRALRPAAAVRRQLVAPFTRCAASSKGPIHIEHEHDRDLDVGELQGAKFKIEPLRRTGEDEHTMRARLLCMRHTLPALPPNGPIMRMRPRLTHDASRPVSQARHPRI